jgi:hypothetical protein
MTILHKDYSEFLTLLNGTNVRVILEFFAA